jgi:hypothetical protein
MTLRRLFPGTQQDELCIKRKCVPSQTYLRIGPDLRAIPTGHNYRQNPIRDSVGQCNSLQASPVLDSSSYCIRVRHSSFQTCGRKGPKMGRTDEHVRAGCQHATTCAHSRRPPSPHPHRKRRDVVAQADFAGSRMPSCSTSRWRLAPDERIPPPVVTHPPTGGHPRHLGRPTMSRACRPSSGGERAPRVSRGFTAGDGDALVEYRVRWMSAYDNGGHQAWRNIGGG